MAKIVVVGGGVIGLSAALELHRHGAEVIVVDQAEFGAACSDGNAGWITPSLSGPVPAPGLVWTSIKWMLSRTSPLYIKPTAIPGMAPWLFRFWRHCNEHDYQAGFDATVRLGQRIMQQYDDLVTAGVQFEMYKTGLLYAFMDEDYMAGAVEDLKQLQAYGYESPVILRGSELRDFEPSLSDKIVSGAWVREERHVRPETLNAGLVHWLERAGVELRPQTKVTGFRRRGSRIDAIETPEGTLEVDQVLIATGAWTGKVAGLAGVRVPIQAGKGYNITVRQPSAVVNHSIYFSEVRIACTPFDGALRIAGTMELSGINTTLDARRLEAIRSGADRCLVNWGQGTGQTAWVGMRPMTPDGLPVIGRAPGFDNLYLASGHAMMGISLAPATAIAIADLMCTGTSEIDLVPFAPARFGGSPQSANVRQAVA